MDVNINLFNNSDIPINMIIEIEDAVTNSLPVSITAGPLVPKNIKSNTLTPNLDINNYLNSKHLNVFIPISDLYNIFITIADTNEEYDFDYDMKDGFHIDLIYSGPNDLAYFIW